MDSGDEVSRRHLKGASRGDCKSVQDGGEGVKQHLLKNWRRVVGGGEL